MSLIVFFSAKGAPGVTTTAMLTAALWPRPALLVDCDPAGGDIGLRQFDPEGHRLDLDRGLLTLLPLARRSVSAEVLLAHAQPTLGGGQVLVGLSGPEQVRAAGLLWTTLGEAFTKLTDSDVIVDVGRLDSTSPLLPLIQYADLAVCVVRASPSGVVTSRSRLRSLAPVLTGPSRLGPRLGAVVRTGKDNRDAASAAEALRVEVPTLDYFGSLVDDPQGAAIFEGNLIARPERTMLVRAGHELVAGLWAVAAPDADPVNASGPSTADGARHAHPEPEGWSGPTVSAGASTGSGTAGAPTGPGTAGAPTGPSPRPAEPGAGDDAARGQGVTETDEARVHLPTNGGRRAARRGRRS